MFGKMLIYFDHILFPKHIIKLNWTVLHPLIVVIIIFVIIILISGSRGIGSTKMNVEVKTDRSCRLMALKTLLEKLPPVNFEILKYIFQHFVQ